MYPMQINLKFDDEAYKNSLKVPQCKISDFNLGSMRFKWNEENKIRSEYFSKTIDKVKENDNMVEEEMTLDGGAFKK